MKRFIAALMALLFLLGISVFAMAEDLPKFSGLVTDAANGNVTVVNAYGNALTFKMADGVEIPDIGALVDIGYTGDLAAQAIASEITVVTPATIKTISGTISTVETDKITVKPTKGNSVTVNLINGTTVSGKAESFKVGDTVTVTYVESVQFMTSVNLALNVEITKVKQEKKSTEEDTTNKKLSGVVTYWDGSKITVRTSKGKKWTFKVNSHTKFPSKKELVEGCTVSITYDGYASNRPVAKKINVTKTAYETEHKTHKKTGTVGQYAAGWCMVFENGTYFDISGAKNSGKKGHRGTGYKATVYYIVDNGTNYATKIKWK